jgi:hypothetical protein
METTAADASAGHELAHQEFIKIKARMFWRLGTATRLNRALRRGVRRLDGRSVGFLKHAPAPLERVAHLSTGGQGRERSGAGRMRTTHQRPKVWLLQTRQQWRYPGPKAAVSRHRWWRDHERTRRIPFFASLSPVTGPLFPDLAEAFAPGLRLRMNRDPNMTKAVGGQNGRTQAEATGWTPKQGTHEAEDYTTGGRPHNGDPACSQPSNLAK